MIQENYATFLLARKKFVWETWQTHILHTAHQISGSNQSQLAPRLCTWQDIWMNDNFLVLIHFPIAPFGWTSFSSPGIELSELPSLGIEILLSPCNYICQTHLPVCSKNVSMIPLLVAEVVPRNMWHDSYGTLFGRVANYIAYYFSSLQSHIYSRVLNICICIHLW